MALDDTSRVQRACVADDCHRPLDQDEIRRGEDENEHVGQRKSRGAEWGICHRQGIRTQVVEEAAVDRHLLDAYDLGRHVREGVLHIGVRAAVPFARQRDLPEIGHERFSRLIPTLSPGGRGRSRVRRCFQDSG
ncbi:hypothetical protein [Streptomyces sp. NPDC052036]|uniref:hypothetical protein n=1 Tax=Streptomyces sp. NPDC052036 TaxID=3155171 RepID=UPI0034478E7F